MLIMTVISLEYKIQPKNAYVITKTIESLLQAHNLNQDFDGFPAEPGNLFEPMTLNLTKSELMNYLNSDFASLMFDNVTSVTTLIN